MTVRVTTSALPDGTGGCFCCKRRLHTDHAMSPEQLLSDAVELLGMGFDLAAVMARAALDTHLRERVALLGRPVRYTGIHP